MSAATSITLALMVSVLVLAWQAYREACRAADALEALARYQAACTAVERHVAASPAAVNTARWIKAKGAGQNAPDIERFRSTVNSRRHA